MPEWVHLLSQWLKIHILPFAPLITASIATIAGIVAIVSIIVTKRTAKRRAAIDFFLKTEMDKALLDLYEAFQTNIKRINEFVKDDTSIEELVKQDGYGTIRTYLNIHELIAVGIKNNVFDRKVSYHFWSAILVSHHKAASRLIEFSWKDPEEASAYIQLTRLSKKWESKIWWWQWRQRNLRKLRFIGRSTAPVNTLPPLPVGNSPILAAQEIAAAVDAELLEEAKAKSDVLPPGPDPAAPAGDQNPDTPSQQTKGPISQSKRLVRTFEDNATRLARK
jgi:Domain of unknown function (DUF4760)